MYNRRRSLSNALPHLPPINPYSESDFGDILVIDDDPASSVTDSIPGNLHINPMDNRRDEFPNAGPLNPYAPPSERGDVTIVPDEQRKILVSVLGWMLAVIGTTATALCALVVAVFFAAEGADWMFFGITGSYCLIYIGGVVAMLATLHGGWKWQTNWIHVLPAVLWTVAFLVVCEFAIFVACFLYGP